MSNAANPSMSQRAKTMLICGLCSGLLVVGGLMAYFVDVEEVINKFVLSDNGLDVELVEPSWEPDPEGVLPGDSYAKDPTIQNTDASISAWAVAEVAVPMGSIDGATVELFDIGGLDTANWTQIGTAVVEDGHMVYTYGYNTAVDPGDSTTALFENVTLKQMSQDEFTVIDTAFGGELEITVTGYGIQYDNTDFDNVTEAWMDYSSQE